MLTEGQGELPIHPETPSRNQQEQVPTSLQRFWSGRRSGGAEDHADAGDAPEELPDGTRKLLSELTQADAAAEFRFRPNLQGTWNPRTVRRSERC